MKAWRLAAAVAKKVAIEQGKHVRGRRYGRLMKAVLGTQRFMAAPSPLFFQLCFHARILKETP